MPNSKSSAELANTVAKQVVKPFEELKDEKLRLDMARIYALDKEMEKQIKEDRLKESSKPINYIDEILVREENRKYEEANKRYEASVKKFGDLGTTPEEKKQLGAIDKAFSHAVKAMDDFGNKVKHVASEGVGVAEKVATAISDGLTKIVSHICDWLSGKTKHKEMVASVAETTKGTVGVTIDSVPELTKDKDQKINLIKAQYAVDKNLDPKMLANMSAVIADIKDKSRIDPPSHKSAVKPLASEIRT